MEKNKNNIFTVLIGISFFAMLSILINLIIDVSAADILKDLSSTSDIKTVEFIRWSEIALILLMVITLLFTISSVIFTNKYLKYGAFISISLLLFVIILLMGISNTFVKDEDKDIIQTSFALVSAFKLNIGSLIIPSILLLIGNIIDMNKNNLFTFNKHKSRQIESEENIDYTYNVKEKDK